MREISFAVAVLLLTFPGSVLASSYYVVMPKGATAPVNLLCLTEEKVAEVSEQKSRCLTLKDAYKIDQDKWAKKEQDYKLGLDERDARIKALEEAAQPSWWSENALEIGVAIGLVAGTAATIGVVGAVQGIK